jgi:hypothetical protein
MKSIFLLFLFIAVLTKSNGEIFTSLQEMTRLVETQSVLTAYLGEIEFNQTSAILNQK